MREDASLLQKNTDYRWTGFAAGAQEGNKYKFYVVGEGTEGIKRDPYALELTTNWPTSDCVLRSAGTFPWQDWTWRTPEFRDLVIYQFHVGTWYGPSQQRRVAKFLDVLVRPQREGGAGFHASWHDGLRIAIRGVIGQASHGRDAAVDWQPVVNQLRAPGFRDAWRAVQCIESHDEVYRDRAPRIPELAGAGGTRPGHGRQRAAHEWRQGFF